MFRCYRIAEYKNEGIPIIRIQNIERNIFIYKNIKFVTKIKSEELSRHSYNVGDIIITKLGSPLGKACIIPDYFFPGIIVADLVRARINHNNISKKFLLYSINSNYVARQLEQNTKGTTRPRVNLSHIRGLKIALPPLPEQYRIVAKIEELFSELDKGIESLKTAQQQLKIYRQAVLKWAFEGKLTAEWREQQQKEGKLESAETLLENIKLKREKRYQQQLEEWEEKVKAWEGNGKEGKKPSKPKKLKQPNFLSKEQINELFQLPPAWSWTVIENIVLDIFDGPFGSNLKTKDYTDSGTRVIRLENIGHLSFNNEKFTFISKEKYKTLTKHTIYHGDIIFSSFISKEIRATIFPLLNTKAIAKADCFCIRVETNNIEKKWLLFFLCSRFSYNNLIHKVHGATRPRINTTQLKSHVIPLCSPSEQRGIVQEIESRFSICDQLEATIKDNLEKSEALRQSILKRAMTGKLVPQDPNDEPAEKLLERIKQEKAGLKNQVKQLKLETC